MDFFQAQEIFTKMYPEKKITFEIDEKCHRVHELIYNDGKPNPIHHVESNKIKITVEGMDSIYIPIMPHRECYSWEDIKKLINSKTEIHQQ